MKLSRSKKILLGLLTPLIILLMVISYTDLHIQKKIQEKRFLTPTEYYSSPQKFYVGQIHSQSSFQKYFDEQNYRFREFGSNLQKGDYSLGNTEQCQTLAKSTSDAFSCVVYRTRFEQQLQLVFLNELDEITDIFTGEDLSPSYFAQGEATLFAQYLGKKPVQQMGVPLSDIPRYCLDAVLAIEDPHFLEHRGVSLRAIFRAIWANLMNARYSQGGSTITQQLVKNYFLTPEKTIQRKIKEIIISSIFEFRVSKDDILETYLNIIYLGQSGVFEVRGYQSASDYYFQKPVSSLDLADCALLAAIVNNPGRYNPVRKPENAKQRRSRVLEKMLEHELISSDEKTEAENKSLPTRLKNKIAASAPYYVDAVNKKLKQLKILDRSGLKVFTALDPKAQTLAEQAVKSGIDNYEKHYPAIKKIKSEKKLNLQALLLASDPLTGEVLAIVGGRDFRSSPYNRAIESQRQVGSVFKPFVYLTALRDYQGELPNYNPLSLINNSPLKVEYDGQTWEPKNYDGKFSSPLPLFFALKESKNVPTARLAMDIGLDKIIETARLLGVESDLKSYPSLSLGAFELKPLEVLKAYNSFSQMGRVRDLQIVKQVSDRKGDILFSNPANEQQVLNKQDVSVLVGMLKQTLISGTGAYSRKMGLKHIAAGKTGTTSDTRDAWFAGFTPFHTAVVWVGYDDGTPNNLTGASGALPIWTNYMKAIAKNYANSDFYFDDHVQKQTVPLEELIDLGVPEEKAQDTELIFIAD